MKPYSLAIGALVFGALLSAPQPGSCLAASPSIGLSTTPAVTYDSVDPAPSDGFIVEPTVDETGPTDAPTPSDGFIVEPTVDATDPSTPSDGSGSDPAQNGGTDPTAPSVIDPGEDFIVEPIVD